MPSDANIYQMLRPVQPMAQGPTPFESAGQAMQISDLFDAQGLRALQRKQLEKGIAEDEQTAAAHREAGGDIAKIPALLYGKGLYKQGQAADTAALARQKTSGEIDKTDTENRAAKVKYLRDLLAGVEDDAGLARWVEEARALKAPIGNNVPQRFDPVWKKQFLATQENFITQNTPKYERVDVGGRIEVLDMNPVTNPNIKGMQLTKTVSPGEALTDERTRSEGRLNRAVTLAGQNQPVYDPERGFVPRPQMGGQSPLMVGPQPGPKVTNRPEPIGNGTPQSSVTPDSQGAARQPGGVITPPGWTPKDKPLTDVQGAATAFGLRATEANKILSRLEGEGVTNTGITRSIATGAAGLVPFIGDKLDSTVGSMMNTLPGIAGGPSARQQQTEQARRDFVNAVLRKESGAVISPQEFDNASKQYFPQPGDDATVIAQKRRNRETAIKALGIQAGPGVKNIPPTLPVNPAGIDPKGLSDAELKRELGI